MKCFEHNGNKCISINGKDYFLLRGYKADQNKFVFVQVAGNTPLRKEDMPTKDWEIIRTKAGSQRVWTAYKKAYFRYDTERECPDLAFVGANTEGSYFLTLRWLAQKCDQSVSDEAMHKIACQLTSKRCSKRGFKRCRDHGASGEDAVVINFGYTFDEKDAIKILKGGQP